MIRIKSPVGAIRPRQLTSGQRWLRGWGRLALIALPIAILYFWVTLGSDANRNSLKLLYPSFSPTWESPGYESPNRWMRIAAGTDFRQLDEPTQRQHAADFFDTELAGLMQALYLNADAFRSTFVRASVEGPIRRDALGEPYRDILAFGHPARAHGSLLLNAAGLGALATAWLWIPVFLLASGIRWVIGGFRGRSDARPG